MLCLYQLALGKKKFVLLLLFGEIIKCTGIILFHRTLSEIVIVFTATIALILLSMVGLVGRETLIDAGD